MGYPHIIDGVGFDVCAMSLKLSDADRRWLDDMSDLLAQTMGQVAEDSRVQGIPVWFSDPRDEFDGEEVCGEPETVHGIRIGDNPEGDAPDAPIPGLSSESFHPKISGTEHYAASLNETLNQLGL